VIAVLHDSRSPETDSFREPNAEELGKETKQLSHASLSRIELIVGLTPHFQQQRFLDTSLQFHA
jgi:hypothetical protein